MTTSCQQAKNNTLQEALQIQDEAIHIGMELNSLISEMMIADTAKLNLQSLGQILIKVKNWEREMIPVPGMKHDHDHGNLSDSLSAHHSHDHAHDHDHNGHVHADGNEIAATLTPAENKEVQISWKNEILAIKAEFEKLTGSASK